MIPMLTFNYAKKRTQNDGVWFATDDKNCKHLITGTSLYLIIVAGQLTDKLDMFFSDAVHLTKQIILDNNLFVSPLSCCSPLFSHTFKVWAHFEVSHQSYLDISKQRHYWKLLRKMKKCS